MKTTTRGLLALLLCAGATLVVACNAIWGLDDLDYSAGAYAGGATFSSGGAGGSAGDGATGHGGGTAGGAGGGTTTCEPGCANRECGPDGCNGSCGTCEPGLSCSAAGRCCPSTWAVLLGAPASALAVWPATQSVYIADSAGWIGHHSTCDGELVLAESYRQLPGEESAVGIERISDTLVVISNGADQAYARHLDPLTLLEDSDSNPPVTLPSNGSTDLVRHVVRGATDVLWMAMDTDGGGLIRYELGRPDACRYDLDTSADQLSRGLAATPDGLVAGLQSTADATPIELLYVHEVPCGGPAGCNQCAPEPPWATPTVSHSPQSIVYGGGTVVSVGLSGDMQYNTTAAVAARYVDGTLQGDWEYDRPQADSLFAVAIDGTTVYVGGGEDGTFVPEMTGQGVLFALPLDFHDGLTPPPVKLEGTLGVYRIAVDADGVYVAGYMPGATTGFLMRCTKSLACPPAPR